MNFKNLEKNNFEKNGIEKWMDGENLFDTFLIYFFKKNFMLTRQEKIKTINDMIVKPLNVGDEYQGDFWIEKVFIGDVLDWIYDNEMTLFEDT